MMAGHLELKTEIEMEMEVKKLVKRGSGTSSWL